MPYRVIITPRAEKQLSKLIVVNQRRIVARLESLGNNPRPSGAIKLSGTDGWRLRVGDYRVLYEIRDTELIVLVVKIGDRKDVYR